jgi:hypothetical protein
MSSVLPAWQKKARLAGSITQIGRYVLWERLAKPRPTDVREVPASTEAFTEEWLTAVLCKGYPAARVTSLKLGAASSGSSDRRAFEVTYNEAGQQAQLPTRLFNKCSKGFYTRLLMLQCGTLENEVGFYSTVRRELDIETPKPYNTALDRRSWRSSIILEDIIATKGAEFLTPLSPVTRSQIEGMLDVLAATHGRFWDSPRLRSEFAWLRTPEEWIRHVEDPIAYERRSAVGMRRSESVIPKSLWAREKDIYPAFRAAMAVSSQGPLTYLHGDPHCRNYYVTNAAKVGVVDWQVTFRGGWGHDFAYTMLSALSIKDRRAWERDLLGYYLDRLKAFGGSPPSLPEAWETYRRQTMYTFVGWLYTIGFGPLQPNMQPDTICLEVIERSAAAVEDLDSVRLLVESK